MSEGSELFADADSGFEAADFVIYGAPYDGTVSHRAGTGLAPANIRKESYNFETYLYEYDIDLVSISIHDKGDLKFHSSTTAALESVSKFSKLMGIQEKFPIMLGGEHSLTVGAVKGLLSSLPDSDEPQLAVVVLDAHLDYRDTYENQRFNHACITRRVSELVGLENIIPIGVRSMSAEEHRAVLDHGLKYYDMDALEEMGMKLILEDVLDLFDNRKIYLSIDMDALDPRDAPAVGNPEPFGMRPEHVRECIEMLAPHLVGFDIMEVSPPYDNGNTAALAARLVRNTIGLVSKKQ